MKLEDVIRTKGTAAVVTIAPQASVTELVTLMADNNIGAVVVSTDGHHIEGIVSERDVVRGLAARGVDALGHDVASLMTPEVVVATPGDGVEETAHTMTARRVRHIPLVVDGELRGLVSIGDVVKARLEETQHETEALKAYIVAG